MRSLALLHLLLTVFALVPAAAAQTPPERTTALLESAFHALDAEHFAGTFTVTTTSLVAKLDGEDREEGSEVWRITVTPGAEPSEEIVSAQEEGVDVTAERRREHEKRRRQKEAREPAKGDDDGDENDGTLSAFLRLPMGDDLQLYSFGAPAREGELVVATFAPLAEHRKREDLALGRLAWHADTGTPEWIEARPVDLPRGAKELSMRFELARAGDLVYVGRTITDGVGGLLWIKRRFHVEVSIADVQPAPPSSPTEP